MAVKGCPKKAVQSPTPIGGLDFLDMDRVLKYLEIQVLDFLDILLAHLPSMRSAHNFPVPVQRAPEHMSCKEKHFNAPAKRDQRQGTSLHS